MIILELIIEKIDSLFIRSLRLSSLISLFTLTEVRIRLLCKLALQYAIAPTSCFKRKYVNPQNPITTLRPFSWLFSKLIRQKQMCSPVRFTSQAYTKVSHCLAFS